ncbi:MAG: hypothetical protein PHZ24_13870 [Bacteroidales bacterium]|nr:hypothetical protein [Bacteroidales bacterium]
MKKTIVYTAILAVIGITFVGGGKISLGQNYSDEIDNEFVYMRNDKFYYKTEEFYLKTCNYLIDMFLDDNNELVVTPSINYFDKWGNTIKLPVNQIDADKYLKAHYSN